MNTLKFAVYEAITIPDGGYIGNWTLLKKLGLRPRKNFTNMMKITEVYKTGLNTMHEQWLIYRQNNSG